MEYVYAVLLLHKLGKPVDEAHLKKVLSATGAEVDESKVKSLLASLHGVDIETELANAALMSVAAAAPAAGASAPVQEKKEEKKEESVAGLSALFG